MQPIEHVLILGAGWVGRQVAARMAQYGLEVWLVDRDHDVCRSALAWMRGLPAANSGLNSLSPATSDDSPDGRDQDRGGSGGRGTTYPKESAQHAWINRVHIDRGLAEFAEPSSEESAPRIDLVIESVPEQLSLKKRVLREVSRTFGPATIICSNSSYFVPSLLSGFVQHPDRFAHMHFHVPVLHDSVVDIVGCAQTQPEVIQRLEALAGRIAQVPLLLRREHPGYIFNWLLQSVLRSALELVALDVADPQDIDRSWTAVTGMPLGPFGIMDRIGLDVIEQVLSNARWAEPPEVGVERLLGLLSAHTSRGELGIKTRRGFYEYPEQVPGS